MPSATVLISGAGTATCQSIIKALRSQDDYAVRIVTMDMNPGNAGRYFSDAFYVVPPANDPAFIPALLELCRRENVDLLIPIIDYEFAKLAAHREAFASCGCTVAISSPAVIRTCTDKWETFQFFRQAGIPTMATWLPGDFQPAPTDYPLFLKPRLLGRGSIGACRANSPAEFATALATAQDPPIIQRLARGEEYTTDILCDFNGRALNGVVRRRVETKAGVSYKGVTVRNAAILDMAINIAETLPINGAVNIQCFCDGNDILFSEINPRYSGTLVLSVAAGFNSPLWLLRLLKGGGHRPRVGDYQDGVNMYRYWQEVFVDADGRRLPSPCIDSGAAVETPTAQRRQPVPVG
jgi:carbamoyl-phosphate synthase large subunit